MSIYVMTWVFMHSPAKANDRLVLLAIADEADDEGLNGHPGLRRIADKVRADVSTAIRSTANLEAGGELLVLRPEKSGKGRFNRYAVVMGRDPIALAEALGWPPPRLTGAPREWDQDTITPADDPAVMVANCDIYIPDEASHSQPEKVAHCDHYDPTERSVTRANGGAGASQNPPDRAEKEAPVRADPLTLGSIDPRAAAPVSKSTPRPASVPTDSVPASLSTGLGHRNRRPADPLDGITEAAAAIAERARARQLELADEPPLVPPPAWKDELRRRLYPTEVSS